MSWFSNVLRPSEAQRSDNSSDEEDEGTRGKGVKEDLSELTKSFSQQLWGVAAFLAPPPPNPTTHRNAFSDDGDDEAPKVHLRFDSIDEAPSRHLKQFRPSMEHAKIDDTEDSTSAYHHSHAKPIGDHLSTVEGSVFGTVEPPLHRSLIEHGKQYHLTGKKESPEELVDIDFKVSMDENHEGPSEDLKGQDLNSIHDPKGSSHILHHRSLDLLGQNAADSLTGISKDLAELKGSVASGFSRILQAVNKEGGQEETSNSLKYNHVEKEEIVDERAGSVHGRKLPGMSMLLGPLLSNILHDDGGKSRSNASSDDEDEEVYKHQHREDYDGQVSSPAHAFKLLNGLKGISEFASSLISGVKEEAWERERNSQVVGISEDVLAFATNISMHPENWLDSPLFAYATKDDDFDMSRAQKEHIHALELAIPRLSVLKTKLCPDCMSESSFWKIYFVLLHSRLNKEDAVILSTPKVMEARLHLLQVLAERKGQEVRTQKRELHASEGKDASAMASSSRAVSEQSAMEVHANDFGQLEDMETNLAEVQNKSILVNTLKLATSNNKGKGKDRDQWLHEECSGLRNEEHVSFSDLEEEDEDVVKSVERSSSTQSFGWVELSKNQSAENLEGLRAFGSPGTQGSRHGDGGGAGGEVGDDASVPVQASGKQYRSESSDWSTVEEDDAAGSDFS